MLENAAAASTLEVDLELVEGCQKFLNVNTSGSVEQDLSHQFDKLNFTDVCFAPGKVQHLYHGKFISANLSTPSNFTAFAFFKQHPLLCIKQDNYLICHLIHEVGIKQSPKEIKSSLMQDVIVPKDYLVGGTVCSCNILWVQWRFYFGSESIAAFEMRRLLLQMGRHKKQFRDMIALNEWFAARFLFAINKCFQRWLSEWKRAQILRVDVNDRIIDFSNVIELVLNGTFSMPLPLSFQRINPEAAINKRSGDDLAKEDNKKKQKSDKKEKQEKLVIVKNKHQHKSFKMKQNKSWKWNFKSAYVDSRPSWDGKKTKKMCIKWHIHG
jgi:hypothetical protein